MNNIEVLLERYYNGETTLEEEQWVREYLAKSSVSTHEADRLLFAGIQAVREEKAMGQPAAKPRRITLKYWAAAGGALAAGLALLFGLRHTTPPAPKLAMTQPSSTVEILVAPNVSGEIKDEQQALEQARRALAFVSSKLNKGTSGINHLNQLEQSISKIQTKEKL